MAMCEDIKRIYLHIVKKINGFFREENSYLALEPNPVVETLFHF